MKSSLLNAEQEKTIIWLSRYTQKIIFTKSITYQEWTECLYLSKIHMLKSHCDDIGEETFGRWLGNDSGAPMNGINVLIKKTPESFQKASFPFPHQEGHLWTKKWVVLLCTFQRHGISWHLALGLLRLQNREK